MRREYELTIIASAHLNEEDHRQLIEDYRNDYEEEYLMNYPEFSVNKLGLDPNLISELPEKESLRKLLYFY